MLTLIQGQSKGETLNCAQNEAEEQLFMKDVLLTGRWTHPKRKWVKDVTPEVLDRYVAAFNKMRENGIEVPCVKDHTVSADTTLGYTRKLWRNGNRLMAVPAIKGKDNIQLVDTVKYVSVAIDENYIDGKGNEYGECITHIGFTPEPVVSGQKGIVRITASRGQTEDALVLTEQTAEVPKMKPEDLKKLQTVFGIQSELTEDSLAEVLTAKFTGVSAELDQVKAESEKVKTASRLDEATMEDRLEEVSDRIERIGKSKQFTPATIKALSAALLGEKSDFLLSRVEKPNEQGRKPVRAHLILDAIESIQVVKQGESTGQQFSASDDGEVSEEDLDKDIKARAAAYLPRK